METIKIESVLEGITYERVSGKATSTLYAVSTILVLLLVDFFGHFGIVRSNVFLGPIQYPLTFGLEQVICELFPLSLVDHFRRRSLWFVREFPFLQLGSEKYVCGSVQVIV